MKKLVLVGGGKAHLYVLKQLQYKNLKNTEILVLSPNKYQYFHNMLAGYVEGFTNKEDVRIDIEKAAQEAGANWKEDAVLSVDPVNKVILTAQGDVLSFDVISFNIGSLIDSYGIPGVIENGLTLKPNYKSIDAMEIGRGATKLVIVGDQSYSIELTLSLQAWGRKKDISQTLTYITPNEQSFHEASDVSHKLESFMKSKGIDVLKNINVQKVQPQALVTAEAGTLPFDQLLWLTGPKAPELFKLANLPIDDRGFLSVEQTLQVKKYPFIFGAGSCVSINDIQQDERNHLHEGHILFKNIDGYFHSGEGELYNPIKQSPTMLSAGDKNGVMFYKERILTGRWVWYLKSWMDKKYIQKFH